MPVFADGFAAAEAEFLLRVGTPPPADQKRFTTEEATAHIDMVHLGIEIASSPLPTINDLGPTVTIRSEEHTSELQSLMRISYAVFCLKQKKKKITRHSIELILDT